LRSIDPGVTGRSDLEPFGVSPRKACVLLDIGNTRLYQLIGNGELESYKEGKARRITMASIRQRVSRLVAAEEKTSGRRPRKLQEATRHEP
jgi:excisionase family DNA binding protein